MRTSHRPIRLTTTLLILVMTACQAPTSTPPTIDESAESFVKLALALGQHDTDFVDAYFGPEEWRDEAASASLSLSEIVSKAREDRMQTEQNPPKDGDEIDELRWLSLVKSLDALIARAEIVDGKELSFDQESQAVYDAVAPRIPAETFEQALEVLAESLPGEGSLAERYQRFRDRFIVPPERLDEVFRAGIEACRARTREHLELPAEESFELEYVTDKSWSAYNWYQGDYRSLIQVNTDLPIYVDRVLDLACHEGYPGHHVYNILLERDLLRKRGWVEYSIYPLFSPRSLLSEGTANFGIEVAFPAESRIAFEREVLFPLAGLDPGAAEDYYRIYDLTRQLNYAGNEAARRYLDGEIGQAEAAEWLSRYLLMTPERAEQRVRFIEKYRSYVINYNLGLDLVRGHIESRGGTSDLPDVRWQEFETLLSNPYVPSKLDG